MYLTELPEHSSFICDIQKVGTMILSFSLLKFRLFLGPILGTVVKNAKHKIVAPGNQTIIALIAPRYTIFAQGPKGPFRAPPYTLFLLKGPSVS